jgi:hypothetical protein
VDNHPLEINVRALLRNEIVFARSMSVDYADWLGIVEHMVCDKLRHPRVSRIHQGLTMKPAVFNGNV